MVRAALACAVLVISAAQQVDAQQTGAAADLVSSWLLVGAERDVASGEPRRVTGSRGLLVLDVNETRAGATKSAKGFRFGRRREILEVTRALASLLPVPRVLVSRFTDTPCFR